ncbi:MAG: polar amino acid transporter, inner rane subunit [Actinoallomurus sp.]|jgi:glutamate transport system permease protein|nr:polar amino acid transporter, inner rane subunit [Actinoallomurus sp.]
MTTTAQKPPQAPTRRPRKDKASVLFDVPGPRAKRRNWLLTLLFSLVFLAVIGLLVWKLAQKHQLDGRLWKPYTDAEVWQNYVWHGLWNTLKATIVAAILALAFGVVFGLARLSDHRWVRVPAGAVVEFFRAIPVLIMMFFALAGPPIIADAFNRVISPVSGFEAVVAGLTLYNGSVLAEIIRAGINSVPKGQWEAGYSIGLRKGGVMLRILVPQAVTAMMPAIVSQLVVLLKDSALGYIIAYEDLLNSGFYQVKGKFGNLIPAAIVVTVVYVAMNMMLGYFANWLERRSRRNRRSSAKIVNAPPAAGMESGVPAA